MERLWDEGDCFRQAASDNCSIVDRLLSWLESDDTEFEVIFGYGVCLAAVTYFIGRLFVLC